MNHLSFVWRFFSTALCFTVFGAGGVLVSVFVCPIQSLIYKDIELRKQKARKMVHYLFKGFVKLLHCTGTASFQIKNKAELEQISGHIVMANHPSLIDVVVLISLIPNADCVVKAKLFHNPCMKYILKSTGYISNDCADGIIHDCQQSLKKGNNLIIFPEGTRTTPGKEIKFQRGAANIALRCEAPITSVMIKVTPTTLTKAEKWYHIPQKRFEFSLELTRAKPNFDMVSDVAMSKLSRRFTSALEKHFIEELKRV